MARPDEAGTEDVPTTLKSVVCVLGFPVGMINGNRVAKNVIQKLSGAASQSEHMLVIVTGKWKCSVVEALSLSLKRNFASVLIANISRCTVEVILQDKFDL